MVGGTVRVRVRCFVVTGGHWVLCVRQRCGRRRVEKSASGLWLEGTLCSMLTVMLGGDLERQGFLVLAS